MKYLKTVQNLWNTLTEELSGHAIGRGDTVTIKKGIKYAVRDISAKHLRVAEIIM